MRDLTLAVDAAARKSAEVRGLEWDGLTAISQYHIREDVTPLVAAAFAAVDSDPLVELERSNRECLDRDSTEADLRRRLYKLAADIREAIFQADV